MIHPSNVARYLEMHLDLTADVTDAHKNYKHHKLNLKVKEDNEMVVRRKSILPS